MHAEFLWGNVLTNVNMKEMWRCEEQIKMKLRETGCEEESRLNWLKIL
jgi:hypothetical protein